MQPIYAPDEGPPKALKSYIKSWTEFLTVSLMAICWFIFVVTYFVDFADDKSFHDGFQLFSISTSADKSMTESLSDSGTRRNRLGHELGRWRRDF